MCEQRVNKRKAIVIGAIAAVIILTVTIATIIWCMQIRLTAPTNIKVGKIELHTIQISWDEVKHATSYLISVYEESEKQAIQCEQADKAEVEITGLYANHSYNISVVAHYDKEDKHIESESSESICVQTLSPELGVIEDIQAVAVDTDSIAVQWTPYQTVDVNADGTSVEISYIVQGAKEENGTYTTLADGLEKPEFLHEGLTELEGYYYKVIVQEKMDDVIYTSKESDMSAFAITGINTVSGLKAEVVSSSEVKISWEPYVTEKTNKDETPVNVWYTLYSAKEENGTYTILAENVEKTEYLQEGLTDLEDCYYKVIANVKMDDVTYTSKQSEKSAFATTGIGAVSGLKAEGISESEIKISWEPYAIEKKNKDGTPVDIRYMLYGGNSENDEFTLLVDGITENSYKEEKLSAETTRFYKVVAIAEKDGSAVTGGMTEVVSAKTQAKKQTTTNSDDGGQKPQSSETAEKDAQAREVAQQIANSITGDTDLEKVRQAAEIVSIYCMYSVYTSSDPDYRTAYGLFCKGVYTCAGATRALGLVLECMGYSWEHINENQWSHQWCQLTMDGQVGWADGMGGIAAYGACPFATGDPYIGEDGTIYFVP